MFCPYVRYLIVLVSPAVLSVFPMAAAQGTDPTPLPLPDVVPTAPVVDATPPPLVATPLPGPVASPVVVPVPAVVVLPGPATSSEPGAMVVPGPVASPGPAATVVAGSEPAASPAPTPVQTVKEALPIDARVQNRVLDTNVPTILGISASVTTVIYFPKPIRGVLGFGLTAGQEAGQPNAFVQYEHPEGSPIVALRALQGFEKLYMTVIMDESLYVFELSNTAQPVVALKLVERPLNDGAREVSYDEVRDGRIHSTPEDLVGLLHKAWNRPVLQKSYASLYTRSEFRKTDAKTDYGDVVVTVTEVHRFADQDATVLLGVIKNHRATPIAFNPASVGVYVGARMYPAQLCDASGTVPAKGEAAIGVVLRGSTEGDREHLSSKNDYRIALPALGSTREVVTTSNALFPRRTTTARDK